METGHVEFLPSDALYDTEKTDFHCIYCPLSEAHEEEGVKTRLVLDKPCKEVYDRYKAEYIAKLTPGSRWTRGQSMITVQKIEDDKVFSISKGDLGDYIKAHHDHVQFKIMFDDVDINDVLACPATYTDDSIFHAGKTWPEGWERKGKKDAEEQPAESRATTTPVEHFISMLDKIYTNVTSADASTPKVDAPPLPSSTALRAALATCTRRETP
jgi:hypothetical protein